MSWLLDVNLLLASRWTTHPNHAAAKAWIDSADRIYTCAITELGFVRLSLSTAYGELGVRPKKRWKNCTNAPAINFLPMMLTVLHYLKSDPKIQLMRIS